MTPSRFAAAGVLFVAFFDRLPSPTSFPIGIRRSCCRRGTQGRLDRSFDHGASVARNYERRLQRAHAACMAKDFEATIASAVAWALVAHIRTLTRRIARAWDQRVSFRVGH